MWDIAQAVIDDDDREDRAIAWPSSWSMVAMIGVDGRDDRGRWSR
jgi:hypothetical protein